MSQELRTNNAEQQISAADYQAVYSGSGVVFSKGRMLVDGELQDPTESFNSPSSNGITQYNTVVWKSPTSGELRISCNCPGWTHAKKGQQRSCKHTKAVIAGTLINREFTLVRVDIGGATPRAATPIPTGNAERQARAITLGRKPKPQS